MCLCSGFWLRLFIVCENCRGVVESPESARTRIGGAIGGIVRGTSELFKMSVFGAVDTFANFADTAGRGLAYVSMDRAYAHNMQSSRLYSYVRTGLASRFISSCAISFHSLTRNASSSIPGSKRTGLLPARRKRRWKRFLGWSKWDHHDAHPRGRKIW